MWTSFFNSAVRRADASFKSSHCTHKMGTLDTPTELPNPCRFVCTHGCQAMERRQQQFWLIPGHQKNAATRDALIYARQCLITEIAFSRESSLKFNAVFAWQYSRTHDHCDKIQYPPAQQGSLLTSRPERELGKPTYTGPRLGTNLTSVAGQVFSGTGIFWTHKTSLALRGTARPLSQCGSYHPLPHNLVQSSPGGHSSQSNQDLSGSAGCGPGRLQHHGKTLLHFSQYRDTSVIFIKNFSHLVSFLPATQSLNYLKSVSQKKKKLNVTPFISWTEHSFALFQGDRENEISLSEVLMQVPSLTWFFINFRMEYYKRHGQAVLYQERMKHAVFFQLSFQALCDTLCSVWRHSTHAGLTIFM